MSTGASLEPTALPGLPTDDDQPVFASPWEAQIFALVVGLHQQGCFSWPEWTECLSEEIAALRTKDEADLGDSYYRLWVIVLERILTDKSIVYSDDIQNRATKWRKAYLNAPHGLPVLLASADRHPAENG